MNHTWQSLRLHGRQIAKTLIWSLNRHRPGSLPDIWIFGSRRSGSTLLRQVIAANPGVKSCDQPFSVRSAGLHDLRLMQAIENGPFLELYAELETGLREYIKEVVAGRLHVNEAALPFSPEFKFRSNRIVFKSTDIPMLADWIEANFRAQIIFLVRHPLSQALSALSNDWIPRYVPYLANRHFVATYLGDDALRECEQVSRRGSALERHVLTWCCENIALLGGIAMPQRGFVTYEDMVACPDELIRRLSASYHLPASDRMMATLLSPSASSGLSSREAVGAIRDRERSKLLSLWRRRVTRADEVDALRILTLFGIDLYRPGNDFATTRFRVPELAPQRASNREVA